MVKKSGNTFSKIIEGFDSMDSSKSLELKKILNSYPYFQSASAYYLKTLKAQKKDSYHELLPKTAILTFNRSLLRNWLSSDEIKDNKVELVKFYLDAYDDFVDGYAIIDFAINKTFFNNYQLGFGIDNLFNFTDPQNISNIAGRIIYGKLNIQF